MHLKVFSGKIWDLLVQINIANTAALFLGDRRGQCGGALPPLHGDPGAQKPGVS